MNGNQQYTVWCVLQDRPCVRTGVHTRSRDTHAHCNTLDLPQVLGRKVHLRRKEKGGLTSTVHAPTADISLLYRITLKEVTLLGERLRPLLISFFVNLGLLTLTEKSSVFFFCFYMSKNDGPLQGIYKLLQPPFLSIRNSCCFKNLKGD